MSASSVPITPARFAAALPDLSLPLLHGKAAEIHNSIAHLLQSNHELESERDDPDCAAAISENEEVVERMRQRLDILKSEVEGRGAIWVWGSLDDLASGKASTADAVNGHANGDMGPDNMNGTSSEAGEHTLEATEDSGAVDSDGTSHTHPSCNGRLTDEELARRVQQQMDELDDDGQGGMHL